jgi:hypothetical protein
MKKQLLITLLFSPFCFANAQSVISTDSIAIFRTDEDNSKRGLVLQKTRGYVSDISASGNGFEISVFKQYNGFMKLEKATAPKGMVSQLNTLPGFAQYAWDDGKLSLKKEKAFSLTRNMASPFAYNFLDVTSLSGGIITDGNVAISNDEIGGDYAKLLQLAPKALSFEGAKHTSKYLYLKTYTEAEYLKTPSYFEPYTARYFTDDRIPKQTKKISLKTDPKNPVIYAFDDYSFVYLSTPKKGVFEINKVDTTGNTVLVDKLTLAENFGLLKHTHAKGQTDKAVFSFGEILTKKGFTMLFGTAATDYKKGNEYLLVRLDANGKIMYKHAFQVSEEGYVFMDVALMANEKDAIVKLTLRKGLKGSLYHIKINEEGVKYQTRWERENNKTAKVITSDSKSQAAGDHQDSYLQTLPNGENVFWGVSYGIGAASGTQKGYGFTHIGADGVILNYYNANCFIPAGLQHQGYSLSAYTLEDGRIVLMANEPRDNSALTLQKYSLLDREYSEKYTLVAKNVPELAILFEQQNLASDKADFKTGNKFLDKVANKTVGLVAAETDAPKRQIQLEESPLAYSPAYYVVDTKKQSIKIFNMNSKGGYSIPDVQNIWFDKTKGELTTFLRTLEKPIESGRNAKPYPRAVFLHSITIGL